jgi:hypothetical protein
VTTLRPGSYRLLTSSDGRNWRVVATVSNATRSTDRLRFSARRARYLRVLITSASTSEPPMLDELAAG